MQTLAKIGFTFITFLMLRLFQDTPKPSEGNPVHLGPQHVLVKSLICVTLEPWNV